MCICLCVHVLNKKFKKLLASRNDFDMRVTKFIPGWPITCYVKDNDHKLIEMDLPLALQLPKFVLTLHRLESSERREPQLRKYLHKIRI